MNHCLTLPVLFRLQPIQKINKTLLLNKIKPILLNRDDKKQTKKEYNIKNIEHIRKKSREYHSKNRDKQNMKI